VEGKNSYFMPDLPGAGYYLYLKPNKKAWREGSRHASLTYRAMN
jgi:hypothetical protein